MEVSPEFAGQTAYSLTTSTSKVQDLGPVAGRVCFLSGIGGHLAASDLGPAPVEETVSIIAFGGEYFLSVSTSGGHTLKVFARCVIGSGTPEVVAHHHGLPDDVIAPVATGRRCFFTGIDIIGSSRPAQQQGGLDGPGAEIELVNDGTNWSLPVNLHVATSISARCVDGTNQGGVALTAQNPGTSTVPLPSGNVTTCGLQDLRGDFTSDDVTDGAFVEKNPAGGLQLTATNGKHALAGCLN